MSSTTTAVDPLPSTKRAKTSCGPAKHHPIESAADATVAAAPSPSPSPSATGTSKRKRSKNTKPIEIKDHPKKDQLPGWKLRTDCNPILHISPDRKIPFRNFKIAKTFAELVVSHGDEHAAFDIIEAEYRNKKRKNGRDLIYSVVSALPRDDDRSRHQSIQPKKALDADQVKVDDLPLASISKILGKRTIGSRIEYLVRFAGLPDVEDAYVPKKKLDSKALRMAKKFDKDAEVKKRRQDRGGPAIDFLLSEFEGACASSFIFNGQPVEAIVFADPGKTDKRCFLDVFSPGRRIMKASYEVSYLKKASRHNPVAKLQENGGTYTAVATRIIDQKSSGRSFGPRKKDAFVYYILTKGGGLPDFNLQKELEKVADFNSLSNHKVPARLELLTSPTPTGHPEYVRRVNSSYFSTIEENGNEGCGFAPPNYIEDLLGNTVEAKRVDAIQVRIFGPKIGIAKGMLMKKVSAKSVELPPSMVKVPPSQCCDENWVVIVVKSVFPSQTNRHIGKFHDPNEKDPLVSDLKWLQHTARFSKMYQRLFQGFGVPGKVLDRYYDQIKRSAAAIKHTHLVGVADPTGQLPPGKVFISGYVGDKRGVRRLFGEMHNKVFLSRSPALVPSDAKLLEVVRSKPPQMTSDNWKHLCSLRFGIVVFPRPLEGMPSLPYQVGEGDLDGDLYLCVFAPMILKSLDESKRRAKKELQVRLPSTGNRVLSREDRSFTTINQATNDSTPIDSTEPGSSSWLSDAQTKILDLRLMANFSALTGQLFKICNDKIDANNFAHSEVRLLSRAYKDSLDSKKHSLTISLPSELRKKINKDLRGLIQNAPETNDGQASTDNDFSEDDEGCQSDKSYQSGAETDNDEGSDPKAAGNDDSSDDESTGSSGSEESDGYIDYYYLSD